MDYKQELITTIHDLGGDLGILEARLTDLSQTYPTAVLIPALFEELERPALAQICFHLQHCPFVQTVVVCLYAQTSQQYARAVAFFSQLPQNTIVLWENGPAVTQILETLQTLGLDLLSLQGKGRAVWLGLGVATLTADAIALHDADITTFDRFYPLKLLYPLLMPEFGIEFNKAYYARIGQEKRLYGRVTRLFVTPLLIALQELFGHYHYLRYLSAFRYPLSGELALTRDLALNTRLPNNWGLEIGLLAEVYRNVTQHRITQIDLGFFDHKHQSLGNAETKGLQKMCQDVLKSVLRTFTEAEQVILTHEHIHDLQVKFQRVAQDLIRQYNIDASVNQLCYNLDQEEATIELFAQVIGETGEAYFRETVDSPIPTWRRVLAIVPDLREQLLTTAQNEAATLAKSAETAHPTLQQ